LSYDAAYVDALRSKGENFKFLPGHPLPKNLTVTAVPAKALAGAELILSAVPTIYLRSFLETRREALSKGVPVLSVTKGIENKTYLRPSQIIQDVLGTDTQVAVLSGPSHAEEVAQQKPTAVSIAHQDDALLRLLQETFMNEYFRVYRNADLLGVELGGALKNVIAIAAGCCQGLGFGDNTRAALLTRGNVEIMRLGVSMGAQAETFMGLSGIGDLITTSYSAFGRNRHVGEKLGQGMSLDEILKTMTGVSEGVWTAKAVHEWRTQLKVETPICEAVYRILFEGLSPKKAVISLMTREGKSESVSHRAI